MLDKKYSTNFVSRAFLARSYFRNFSSNTSFCRSTNYYRLSSVYIHDFNILQKNGPHTGVYIVPSAKSTLIWFGVIFVRSGYYSGAVFKFRIHIPHDFPHNEKPPFVAFDPPIFHPLVDQRTGELEFNKFIPKWKRHVN